MGYGFVLEEDIVLFNLSFDLIGQVWLFYMCVGQIEGRFIGILCIEDEYVYWCVELVFCNYMLLELLYVGLMVVILVVVCDYVVIIVCYFLYVVLMVLFWEVLMCLIDIELVVIVVKLVKEMCYYFVYMCDWFVCFGDGIDELYVWA